MARFFVHRFPVTRRKAAVVLLAFLFAMGLLSGTVLFVSAGSPQLLTAAGIADNVVSTFGMLCASVFPFLLSAFAVSLRMRWLLLPIAFGKAFLFSLVSLGIMWSSGSDGWMVRGLFMFCDICGLPLLYLYWHRSLYREQNCSSMEGILILSLLVLLGSIDYCLITPIFSD